MSYTAEEFKAALDDWATIKFASHNYFSVEDMWHEIDSYLNETPEEVEPGVTVALIDSHDVNYSDDYTRAEQVWQVFEVVFKDGSRQYFKREGTYASYVGHEWEGIREVTPTQKTITVFE